jgi:hypothetical protein
VKTDEQIILDRWVRRFAHGPVTEQNERAPAWPHVWAIAAASDNEDSLFYVETGIWLGAAWPGPWWGRTDETCLWCECGTIPGTRGIFHMDGTLNECQGGDE